MSMRAEVSIRWSEGLDKPYINFYRVHANDHYLFTIQGSADEKSPRFDINAYNPIFLLEDVSPKQAEDALFKMYRSNYETFREEIDSDDDESDSWPFQLGILSWSSYELTQEFEGSGRYAFDISAGLDSVLPDRQASIYFNFPEKEFPIHKPKNGQDKNRLWMTNIFTRHSRIISLCC